MGDGSLVEPPPEVVRALSATLDRSEESTSRAARPVIPTRENLRPLTVIRAPMGWGKTALLDAWIANLPGECPRLLVDVETADWLDNLRSWSESLTGPGVVVIDDYERAASTANDFALLRAVTANPHLSLVVAGRRYSVLDTPVVTSRVDTTLITRADLALTDDEVAQIVSAAGVPSSKRLEKTLSKAAGWRLVVEELVAIHADDPDGTVVEVSRLSVCAVLADPAAKKVLRLVSLTRGTSTRVLRRASGLDEGRLERALANLLETGLIGERSYGSRIYYVPHEVLESLPAFDDANVLNEDEERVLTLHAEELARVDPLSALRLLVDRGMLDAAGSLGQRYSLKLASRPAEVAEVFAEVGDRGVTKTPSLASLRLFLGFANAQTPTPTLRTWGRGLRSFASDTPPDGAPTTVGDSALRLVTQLAEGSWRAVSDTAVKLEGVLAERSHAARWGERTTTPLLYSLVAVAGLLSGDLALAERAAKQSLNVAKIENSPEAQAEAHYILALIASMQGKVEQTTFRLEAAGGLRENSTLWLSDASRVNAVVAEATVLLAHGDLNEAKEKLVTLEPVVARTAGFEAYVRLGTWLMRLTEGNKSAFEWLRRRLTEISTAWPNPAIQSNLTAAAANLLIYEGELRSAEELLRASPQATEQVLLSQVRLLFARGKANRVQPLLLKLDFPDADPVAVSMAALMRAVAQAETGDMPGALSALEGMEVSSQDSMVALLLTTIPYEPLRRLAEASAETGNDRWLRLVEDLPDEHRFRTLEPLSRSEREVLELLAEEKSVREVASARGVSVNTIKGQTRVIYRKLQVSDRAGVVRVARGMGLV